MATIYVALSENGFPVAFRPVEAEQIAADEFRILGPIPEDEEWAFQPGETVRCRERFTGGDFHLLAIEKV